MNLGQATAWWPAAHDLQGECQLLHANFNDPLINLNQLQPGKKQILNGR